MSARLPRRGMPVVIEATDKQRAALAEIHALASVERFRAELLVSPWKRNGVQVEGKVEADIVQECIVTLEPLPDHVTEVGVRCVPARAVEAWPRRVR